MTSHHDNNSPDTGRDTQIVDEAVIHDLLNPLTAVIGNLDFVAELLGESASAVVRKRLEEGLASADELCVMLENLRTLISSGVGVAGTTVRVDLASILARLQPEPNPTLPDALAVIGNETHLRRAAEVLYRAAGRVGNATSVEINCNVPGHIELRFYHRGRTIPQPVIDRLFDADLPAVQAEHNLRIDRARGLWFARTVAELHGGSIRYNSHNDGGCFIMRLPLAA